MRSSFESFVNDVVDLYRGIGIDLVLSLNSTIYFRFLIELLRKPILEIEPDAVRKLKIFYQTCVSAGNNFFC